MKKKTLWIALLSTLCAVTLTAAACSGNTGGGSNRKPEKYSQLDAPNDPDIVIDGKLDDAVYGSELNWLTNTYRQNVSGNMPVLQYTGFTTSYGIYVAGKVTDSNICWQDRGGWAPTVNSTWDINFVVDKKGEAPLTERHNRNRFQTDVKGEDVYASISCPRVRYATSVEGELNSRKTTSASIELFVPWSQFGFTQEEIPDDFGIVMQYLAVLGTNQSTTWLSMMTNIDESENYFRVDQNGYTNPDGEDAVLGNSKFGVARSAGWDLSREAEGIVQCVGGRSDQTIFFKDAYADNYSVKTAIVPIESVHEDTPQVGFLMMNAQEYYYNVTLNLANENLTAGDNGTKKIKNIEFYATQNMPVWSRWVMKEKRANAQADDKDLTLEVVKKGAKIYVFVNDEFITMKEVPFVAGNLMVGLEAIGINTIFKDYAFNAMSASGAETRLNELGVHSVEAEVLTVGGNAEVDADRENPQVRFTAQSGYELDRVTQNGTDITDDVKANAESGVYTLEGLSSPALLQVSYKQIAPENAATYSGKITFAGSGVLGKLSLTNSAIPYACYEQISNPDGTFNVVLPKGEWGVRAVYQDVWVSEKSVNLTDDVTSDTIECASAQLGAWSSVTISDVQTANDFAIFAKTESAGVSYFNEAGILVKVGGVNYGFLFGNDKLVLRNWNDPDDIPLVWQVNPTDMNAADFTCGLSFNGERYTAYINGAAVREITAYDLGAKIDKYTDLFGNKAKAIGFITRVSPVNYSEFDYAVTADEVSELLTQKNITFDYKNVTLKYIDGEATESNTSAMGVATLAAERVLPNGNVVLTVKPNAGHMVVSVKKNGVEIMQSLVHTKDGYAVTLTGVTEDTALVVGFAEEVSVYTVTGAYDYAEGLYSAGDRVTVKSGLYKGIVNVADKTYTIDIPEGERQITVSGLLYQDVTVTVTVTTEGATAQKATFDRVKLEAHLDGGSISPTDDGYSFGTWTLAKFCGVTATDKFYSEATVTFDNTDSQAANRMPGFLVYTDEEFAIFPYFHGGELDFVIRRWNGADITLDTNVPFTKNTAEGVQIALVFQSGTYTVLVDGKAYFEITQEEADENSAKFFESNTEKRFGLVTRASGAEFSDIAYTLDGAAIESKLESGMREVAVSVDGGNGSVTPATVKTLYGGSVTFTATADAGYELSAVMVGTTDVTNADGTEISQKDKVYTVTLKNPNAAISVKFVAEKQYYTVSGTISYAEGLYSTGDVVTVKSGSIEGTVNGSNYTIRLPEGANTVTFTSARFMEKTAELSLSADATQNVSFDRVKLEDHFNSGSITPADDGYSFGTWTLAKFCGVTATDKFYIETTVKFDNNGALEANQMPGFLVYSGETEHGLFPYFHGNVLDFVLVSWNGGNSVISVGLDASGMNTSAGVKIGLAYLNGKYTAIVDGKAYCEISSDSDPKFNDLFSATSNKQIGILTRNITAEFSDIAYTLDGAAIESKLESGMREVAVSVDGGNGSVTPATVKTLYGGNVTFTATADAGYELSTVMVGTTDVTNADGTEISQNDKVYTVTLKNPNAAISVKFVAEKQYYTVSGTFAWQEGQYKPSDEVTVTCGSNQATVSGTGYTMSLPDGTHDLTLSCNGFVEEKVTVTVNGASVTAPSVTFTPKLKDGTYNAVDKSWTYADWENGWFYAGNGSDSLNVSGNFMLKAHLRTKKVAHSDVGGASGFGIQIQTGWGISPYVINVNDNGTAWAGLRFYHPTDGAAHVTCSTGDTQVTVTVDGEYVEYDIGLVFKDGVYYAFVNDTFVGKADANSGVSDEGLFQKESGKFIGLRARTGSTYKNVYYSCDAALIEAKADKAYVTVSVAQCENGTATSESVKVMIGSAVTLNVTANSGYKLKEVKVGENAESARITRNDSNTYTVSIESYKGETVTVTFEAGQDYRVSGTFAWQEGQYKPSDEVTVTCGSNQATVCGAGYTIYLSDGTHDLTLSCNGFVEEKVTVTVNGASVTAPSVTFTPKLESHFDGGSITPTAGGYSLGTWTLAKFCGVTATDMFYIETTVKFDNNGALEANQMPGFLIYSGEEFAIFPYFHGGELDFVIRRWNGADITLETNIPFTENTSDGVRIALAFRDGTYTVLVNGNACCEITQEKADANSAKFFESNTEKRFGLVTRASGAEFSNIVYTLDAAAIEAEVNKTTNAT